MISTYARMLWNYLREYAVWTPGSATRLGDFGLIRDGCFQRAGHISDIIGDTQIKTRSSTLDAMFCMSKKGVQAYAKAGDGLGSTARFTFGRECGAVLSASGVSAKTIENLRDVSRALQENKTWERHFQVVTTLRKAESQTVLVTGSSGGDLSVSASDELLQAFLRGEPVADAGLKIEGAVGLQMVGQNGPVSVQLHRLKRLGDGFRHLSGTDAETAEFGLVPVIDPVE